MDTSRKSHLCKPGLYGLFALFLNACASNSYLLGAGAYTPAIGKLSSTETGQSGTLSKPLAYPITLRVDSAGAASRHFLSVDINPLPVKTAEGGISQYHLQSRLGWAPRYLSLGPMQLLAISSLHFQFLKGNGQAYELNNGTTTATFYTPGYTQTIKTLNLGAELNFAITDDWAISQGLLADAPFSRTRRQWSAYLTILYRWKGQAL